MPDHSQEEFHYGDRVICVDTDSQWYGQSGVIAGKNKNNLGVKFDHDPNPPATGRWVPKSKTRLVAPTEQLRPWLQELIIHHNYVYRDINIKIGAPEDGLRHLVLTGRNGSGKSTVLRSLWEELSTGKWGARLERMRADNPKSFHADVTRIIGNEPCVEPIYWDNLLDISVQRQNGHLLAVYVPATRRLPVSNVKGPEAVDWQAALQQGEISRLLMQYLVNRRTDQAFASEEGRNEDVESHRHWFSNLQQIFRDLLDEPTLELTFQRSEYRFDMRIRGGTEVRLDQLPDGYSSLLRIWADVFLTEEAARSLHPDVKTWRGIIIIDEIEAHLHLELQESVFALLTQLFPSFQFVVSTHSPAILASVGNATIYDLGTNKMLPSDELRGVPYGAIMTGHFGISSDIDLQTTQFLQRWRALLHQSKRTPEEEKELKQLAAELAERSSTLALEVWDAMERPRLEQIVAERNG